MANKKAKKNNKNMIIGVCVAVAIVVVIIITAFAVGAGNKLNDSYFVSDDTKYVLTMEGDELGAGITEGDGSEVTPVKTHIVYTYSGDEITGAFFYLEYADEAQAKTAYENYQDEWKEEGIKDFKTNGKYLVIEMEASQYEGKTASDVKQEFELYESLKNMNFDEMDATEIDEEGVVTEENQ